VFDQVTLVTTCARAPGSQSGRSMRSAWMIWSQLMAICFGFGTGSLLDPGRARIGSLALPRWLEKPPRVSSRIGDSARQYKSKPKPYTVPE
jgi:hypothetical protein